MLCFFFFFSSRRRHTRWPRDWSSDVCSSDLGENSTSEGCNEYNMLKLTHELFRVTKDRSEERRVGKECRARWWPYDGKKRKKGDDARWARRVRERRRTEARKKKVNGGGARLR